MNADPRLWRWTFGYESHENVSAIFNLSNEPASRSCWSASARRLPCPSTNSKLWSSRQQRYLLPFELLLAFGVPATPEAAAGAHIPMCTLPPDVAFTKIIGHLDVLTFYFGNCETE